MTLAEQIRGPEQIRCDTGMKQGDKPELTEGQRLIQLKRLGGGGGGGGPLTFEGPLTTGCPRGTTCDDTRSPGGLPIAI